VGEDDLTCALGRRIVGGILRKWTAAAPPINTRGVTKLVTSLPRYQQFAQNVGHVLCIADSDGRCPASLMQEWLPNGRPDRLLVRLAVNEGESWALGDRRAVAAHFHVPLNVVPRTPDELPDAKREFLRVVKRSTKRRLRDDMVSSSQGADTPGVGYNVHMRLFVETSWNAEEAEQNSPSLHRAMDRVRALVLGD
jgi:hypothetical protein